MAHVRDISPTLKAYKAGQKVSVSKNFNADEFWDGISEWIILDSRLIERLQKLRDHLMCPIKITSGFRSSEKQKELTDRGFETAQLSTHLFGSAADIWTGKHTGEQLERAARLCGFTSVGLAPNWVHVDIRPGERSWVYSKRKS